MNKRLLLWGRILALVALVAAFAVSGAFVGMMQGVGLVFVVLGGAAAAMMSFSFSEIGAAFKCAVSGRGTREEIRRSGFLWEASARNFWMVGVFAGILSFVDALTSMSEGIGAVASGMASSLVPSVYGIVLGAVCLVPSWKLGRILRTITPSDVSSIAAGSDRRPEAFGRLETVLGYFLFIGLTVWTTIRPVLSVSPGPVKTWAWYLNGPALLLILGGTTALILFVGKAVAGVPLTASFALTGLIGAFMGFIQVLLGFASSQFTQAAADDIASGMSLVISSCFLGLAGMILAGSPLEDRSVKAGRIEKPSAISRAAWAVFPLVAMIFLVITFFLVITPVRK
jgi:flagellar motor component MotA